jgi:hypothetical protein
MPTDEGQKGKRCAALDLKELFNREKIHCPRCPVRDKTGLDEQGEKRVGKDHYHQAVTLAWVSVAIPMVLGRESLAPGEGELTVPLRLLVSLAPACAQTWT